MNLLIGSGADPNVQDDSGRSPVFSACLGHDAVGLRTLLEAGARLDIRDKGVSAASFSVF